eukprot:CFRG3680T1
MRPALRLLMARKVLLPRMTLFGKANGCSLCEDAKDVLRSVEDVAPHSVQFVDITDPGEEEYFEEYKWDIPVLHLNGKEIMRHRINPDKLIAAIHSEQTKVGKG